MCDVEKGFSLGYSSRSRQQCILAMSDRNTQNADLKHSTFSLEVCQHSRCFHLSCMVFPSSVEFWLSMSLQRAVFEQTLTLKWHSPALACFAFGIFVVSRPLHHPDLTLIRDLVEFVGKEKFFYLQSKKVDEVRTKKGSSTSHFSSRCITDMTTTLMPSESWSSKLLWPDFHSLLLTVRGLM